MSLILLWVAENPLAVFVLQSVGISLSGVMAPGALTAMTVGHGSRAARSGAVVALGHGVVEFPLMVALYYGFGTLLEVPVARAAIGAAGGLVLLWMGVGMIRGREQSGDWDNPSAINVQHCTDRTQSVSGIKITISIHRMLGAPLGF